MGKRELRKRMREVREALGPDARTATDVEIARHVTALSVYLEANVLLMLLTYLSVGVGVDAHRYP